LLGLRGRGMGTVKAPGGIEGSIFIFQVLDFFLSRGVFPD
jgi:hypothetical protein